MCGRADEGLVRVEMAGAGGLGMLAEASVRA